MARDGVGVSLTEVAVLFDCLGEELVGIVCVPERVDYRCGVLVIVGGPQYRAGSHRQFVLLTRELANRGIASMRFDYRGMGDATGPARPFDRNAPDIRAAIDTFLAHAPGIECVVLWGLCDGATAACLYSPLDTRVRGMVLLNPWVRTPAVEARALLRHHYLKRLLDPQFWSRLLRGRVAIGAAAAGVARYARDAVAGSRRRDAAAAGETLPDAMARCVGRSHARFAIGLSGRDYVAREFEQVMSQATWASLIRGPRALGVECWPSADHTFSSSTWQHPIAAMCERAVRDVEGKNSRGS
jgi:exosortase A-associated hydrolase 1